MPYRVLGQDGSPGRPSVQEDKLVYRGFRGKSRGLGLWVALDFFYVLCITVGAWVSGRNRGVRGPIAICKPGTFGSGVTRK